MQAGDLLLYKGLWLIRTKTWSNVGHCEIYIGDGQTVTARNAGVNIYPLSTKEEPRYVLRPKDPFDLKVALQHFRREMLGQPYDWIGLYLSFVAVRQGRNNKAGFCSETNTRVYRWGGFEPFTPEVDADAVAPSNFLYSPKFDRILDWTRA